MKKRMFVMVAIMMVAMLLMPMTVGASEISLYGDPDGTVDTPSSLPYSTSFRFKNGSTTNSIERTSSTVTVTLEDAYLTTNRSAKITIAAYYWNGSTWKSADSDSVTINGTADDYSVKLSISSGSVFYVKLSKTDYTGYYATGTVTIE